MLSDMFCGELLNITKLHCREGHQVKAGQDMHTVSLPVKMPGVGHRLCSFMYYFVLHCSILICILLYVYLIVLFRSILNHSVILWSIFSIFSKSYSLFDIVLFCSTLFYYVHCYAILCRNQPLKDLSTCFLKRKIWTRKTKR